MERLFEKQQPIRANFPEQPSFQSSALWSWSVCPNMGSFLIFDHKFCPQTYQSTSPFVMHSDSCLYHLFIVNTKSPSVCLSLCPSLCLYLCFCFSVSSLSKDSFQLKSTQSINWKSKIFPSTLKQLLMKNRKIYQFHRIYQNYLFTIGFSWSNFFKFF